MVVTGGYIGMVIAYVTAIGSDSSATENNSGSSQ